MAYAMTTRARERDRWVKVLTEATGRQPTVFLVEGRPRSWRIQDNEVGSEYLNHILDLEDHNKTACSFCDHSKL